MRIILLSFIFFLFSCQQTKYPFTLKNGDLILVGNSDGNLSKAITEVTQTTKGTNYSHIALIEKQGPKFWVLHAAPENGSERILLDEFLLKEKKNSKTIDVYRIKSAFNPNHSQAISSAKNMLGKPYNFSYILSDSAYYCSDFIYNAYEDDTIFEMNPMTFKNPGEENFNQGWIDFYEKQKIEIPEGQLGCNPNGMAASEKLIKVGTL